MKIEMKSLRTLAVFSPCVLLVACDQAKEIAGKAAKVVTEELVEKGKGKEESKVDEKLAALVDQTEEGVRFRSDLAFPTRVDVVRNSHFKVSGRVFRSSELGREVLKQVGTRVEVSKLEGAGKQVRYTLQKSGFVTPNAEETAEQAREKLENLGGGEKPLVFEKTGNGWKADPAGGFRGAALARELSGRFDTLLLDHGLRPRSVWFPEDRRFQAGDTIRLSGDSLGVLVAGNAVGNLDLTYESMEAVDGHPCGVFAVTGDYRRRKMPSFDGQLTDEDVTVESGKVWVSLIYPLVLREELESIQTYHSGSGGGQEERYQGEVGVSVTRTWRTL